MHCLLIARLQVLRCRRLHASAPASAARAAKGLHSMVTLQLDSFSADGAPLTSTTLSFVELAAPEPKVGCNSEGKLAPSSHVPQEQQRLELCKPWQHKSRTATLAAEVFCF